MAALTTFGPHNKVTHEALRIEYTWDDDPITGDVKTELVPNTDPKQYVDVSTFYVKVYRQAKKSYSYIGMDYATACACANYLIGRYTHPTRLFALHTTVNGRTGRVISKSIDFISTVPVCGAKIKVVHRDASLWDVDVEVDDRDRSVGRVVRRSDDVLNPQYSNLEELFSWAGERFYDEDGGTHVENGEGELSEDGDGENENGGSGGNVSL